MNTFVRLGLALVAVPLACRSADVIWTIGHTDNSADEFGRGATRSVVYDVTSGADPKKWPARQAVADDNTIRFVMTELGAAGASPLEHHRTASRSRPICTPCWIGPASTVRMCSPVIRRAGSTS